MRAFINWSGGKDCTLALHHILHQKDVKVDYLFTTISREHQRVSMHGVRKEMITRQAMSIGIPSRKLYLPEKTDRPVYDQFMAHEMKLMKQRGISDAIFGDIFLEDLRKYREEKLKSVEMNAHFPLWGKPTSQLLTEFIGLGYKAMIVSVNYEHLDQSFLGKTLDHELVKHFPSQVDVCGENGEFHTFVYDGPIFHSPIKMVLGEKVTKTYSHQDKNYEFGFLDLIPQ